ncbi:TPA: autotransporter domain-containing protein [Escherichia coli]|uniref:BigA/YdbA N-terminal beta-barrel domain-containing protein n=1 Tax=Escherichia coli TaxID=562 RepID=UPI0019261AFB|nr:autotransporter domain-containing protein [Escherichia coli]HCO2554467.1 autotransporter domain-containing protein [Escherichia coli]HCO2558466.1 autotransporter domain-containing protein [Escherichia coli]HCO2572189.1 autotransporter domain-containing protein [Escherichia coli]HCS6236191.1 autotransporter domain-containing protein [Escherichia coli]HCS6293931.1 autotransporter domain-containing protein [Escherichia coli]
MQRKTLLSACIALALSGQGWAADITEVETTTGEKKNTNVTCPADPGKLSPEELKRLPSECSPLVEQNLMPWLSTGAAALITALAVVELNDDDDHHHRNNSPLPPTPPDDESDDTPVPPTPGGDEIIPDDPDDTPTPPKPVSFNNDVILDKTEKTLTIRDSVFTYTENADGTISLQDSNGRKATINLWQIDEANNTVALEGVSADGATKWQYNHNGELVITGDNATVNNNGKTTVDGKDSTGTEINGNNGKVIQDGDLDVSGGGHGIDITGDSATVDNKGTMTVTDPESIGIQIDGDKAVVNNEGESTITNGGTGTQINGDDATANNTGKTTVDGKDSTGTEINGNNGNVIQDGDLDVSGGGHGIDITGDSATVDNKGTMTVTDPESMGIQIDGDKAIVNNEGESTITNGGTGTQINGDDATANNNGKTTVDGKDSTGTEINGNNGKVIQDGDLDVSGGGHGIDITGDQAVVNNEGESAITNGGTGTQINGDDATANNNGKTTVDGKDSTGTEIAGNNGKVIQDGDLDVSGGGHGIDITGDSATVDNKGTMTVTDPESIGIQIDGDQAIVNNEGESTITNGGTGTQINGNDATANNSGKTTVDGKDSTGTKIAGNIGIVNLDGSLTVTGGAHGVENIGDNGTVNNKGDIVVSDTGSIGVLINGEGATVSNTGDVNVSNEATGFSITTNSGKVSLAGSMQVGDFSTGVDLNGNNNSVTLAAKDLKVVGQKATGINVSGDANTVNITGNVLVDKDKTADNAAEYFFDPSVGINVYGSDNNVTLDGKLTVVSDSEVTSRQSNLFDGSAEKTSGLVVIGDGNTVNMNGGLELIGEKNALADGSQVASLRTGYSYTSVIVVSGESSVYLNGDTTISGEFPLGFAGVIRVQDKALLEIGSGATLTMQDIDSFEHHGTRTPELTYADSGAKIVNKGTVEIQNLGFAFVTGENTTGINSGTISLLQNGKDPAPSPIVLLATNGGSATNAGTITGKVTEQHSVFNKYSTGTSNSFIFNNDVSSITGLVAQSNSTIINTDSGIIDLYGRGSVGMLAIADSTAENQGKITLDSMWVDANDTTAMRDIASNSAIDFGTGVGVGTDSYSGAGKNATAINQLGGVITIYNAGAGMAAYGASNTVINQGTINLEKNGNYDDSLAANTLVGMAVYEHGTAINDQTGVININVGTGQAFYNDGTGTIVNYGTICTFGVCQSGNEYNNTDDFTSLIYTGGDTIIRSGETVTLNKSAAVTDKLAGNVVNSGTLSGDQITVSSGLLENTSGGIINNLVKLDKGAVIKNAGVMTNNVDVSGGILNNAGEMTAQITMNAGADSSLVNNTGTINKIVQNAGVFNNSGSVTGRMMSAGGVFNNQTDGAIMRGAALTGTAVANNEGTWNLGSSSEGNDTGMLEVNNNSAFNNRGEFILDNDKNAVHINQSGTLYNTGHMNISNSSHNGAVNMWGGNGRFINDGTIDVSAKSLVVSANNAGDQNAFFWNQDNGVINFDHDSASAVKVTHSNFIAQNDGIMNISGTGAVAMEGDKNAQLVNNGTINLGTAGTTDTGMIGMQLDANATADAVIENNGTINIFANDSFAFSVLGTVGHVVNNGTVVIADGVTGSGLIKQGDSINVEGMNGNNGNSSEVHYGDYTLPDVPKPNTVSVTSGSDEAGGSMNNLNGYVVGTNVNGSAGKLKVNNASMNGVEINTGFTAGTADTTVSFDNVVEGSNLTDADAITSTSVVWTAKGSTDASGNVDVTMSKNAYTDVATDASVNDIAKALDAGYTNNELFTSLNVGTTAELNSALKQVSGSQATTVFREARVLSNRFSMLADAAPKVGNGLAFNVVAKGDPRAELGNNTEYDMLALRKTIDLSESQTMSLEYGIARLDGDGAQKAGDNGVTGGYSQFFGLKHQMSFDNGMNWNNALRYDVHNLDSSRSIAFGNTNKTAETDVKQQYLEFRSEGAKTFEPSEGLKVTPYAGVKLRHTLEGGYQERNAGDFNLNMNSGSETAVDSIVGLKLDYAGKDGWSASATLEGGPNLSYAKSQRTASLAGAGSQHFNVDDGQKGGGINSLTSVGVKYSSKESSLNLDAYNWKEDGISDKGVMLNFKKTF